MAEALAGSDAGGAGGATIPVGSRVTLFGLTSQAGLELNGRSGITIGTENSAGRLPVQLTLTTEKLIRVENLKMEDQEGSMLIVVNSHTYVVSRTVISKYPESFFAAALRQQSHMGTAENGEIRLDRLNGHLYAHVFRFLNCWPSGEVPLISHELSAEMASEILVEADFLLLPAMAWLMNAHTVNVQLLEREDLYHRQSEDTMRWLFARQRDAPELKDPYLGLCHLPVESPRGQEPTAGRNNTYPLCLSNISPAIDTNVGGWHCMLHFEVFKKNYPGVMDALKACPTDATCSWFIAGGSVLRCILKDPRAVPLFSSSDVDIFICASGDVAEARATELSRRICEELKKQCNAIWITRTVFTLNIRCSGQIERDSYGGRSYTATEPFDVQIILRLYHSPAEVLCGFDIDCCCVGFGPPEQTNGRPKIWALPRALTALRKSRSLLNPLHAWPRQPSYEAPAQELKLFSRPLLAARLLTLLRTSESPVNQLRLAKYAARGFPVAVPGLLEAPNSGAALQWQSITRQRLIGLRGGARLVHIDMALSLPENCTVKTCNPDFRAGRAGNGPGYRGARHRATNWEAAIHRTFGQRDTSHDSGEWPITYPTLPTDYDQVMTIIKDPYGWIAANYDYTPEDGPSDDTLKFVQVQLDAHAFDDAWALIQDCERDDMHIPRLLTWMLLPRSREYMNMEKPFSELWMAYQSPLFDHVATTARVTEAEYGDPFLEQFRQLAL